MEKNRTFIDISLFLLIFLFSVFALSNLGFFFGVSVLKGYIVYILVSFLISFLVLFKRNFSGRVLDKGAFFKKTIIIFLFFLISLILANFFIDTSFDGRCYHFTLENLFKLGFNPITEKSPEAFACKNNVFYNLLFALNYPNALELLRSNFYLLFSNMESSKIVNFLFCFLGWFYSIYFFEKLKVKNTKAVLLSICVLLNSVVICQVNTKMADFIMYYLFLLQVMSAILINRKKDFKENAFVFISSTVLSIATKFTGLLNSVIIVIIFLLNKFDKKKIKIILLAVFSALILCFQPYFTNIIKHKNPFYPSFGFNKLDFMTKQNPVEFQNKPYIYKFIRSMFSSASDSRLGNPETPRLFWKVPFTSHYDMPFVAEDVRISGFGHLFSGIFLISLFLSIFLLIKSKRKKSKKGVFIFSAIYLTTLLNPICWWARFVPQLHLLPVFSSFYFRKKKIVFYTLTFLIIVNGVWTVIENVSVGAYKTYVMNNFYNELYEKSLNNRLKVFVDKNSKEKDENDSTILPRMKEYGIEFDVVEERDLSFKPIKTDCTITKSYWVKF